MGIGRFRRWSQHCEVQGFAETSAQVSSWTASMPRALNLPRRLAWSGSSSPLVHRHYLGAQCSATGAACKRETRKINAVLRRLGAARRGLQAMVPDAPWEGPSRILACLGSRSVIRVVSSQVGLTLQTAGSLSLKLDTCEVPWLCARGGCTSKAAISSFHPGMLGISFLLDYGVPYWGKLREAPQACTW